MRILSRLHAQCRAQCGARPHDPRIMTWAEIKTQTLQVPGWLSRLSVGLQLRSWSHGSCSSPASSSVLTAQNLEPASDSVSPSLSAPPLLMLCLSVCLSLSKINKHLKNVNKRSLLQISLHCVMLPHRPLSSTFNVVDLHSNGFHLLSLFLTHSVHPIFSMPHLENETQSLSTFI